VTKKEIVRTIAHQTGLPPQDIKRIVQETFDSIIETLVEEGRLELRNFGVFQVKTRGARKARNPKSGQEVAVPERFVVTFKPGLIMQQKVASVDPVKAANWETVSATSDPDGDQDD
jgi:nucleoid DNA-binding protein